LVETRQNKAPTEVLVTDLPSVINLAGWVLCIVWILYDVS